MSILTITKFPIMIPFWLLNKYDSVIVVDVELLVVLFIPEINEESADNLVLDFVDESDPSAE